jgi:hypothetical protein
MSAQTLSASELTDDLPELGASPPDAAPWALRVFAVVAVCLGVAALAAGTFVLSYSAIRAVALQAGITPRLARGYPLLLDVMLVIVLAAILALRGAGLPSRLLAWLTLVLVMAVAAGADALHTAGRTMPHQAAAITAAVLPFVLVLIAFTLLLVMLRHARLGRLPDSADRGSADGSSWALGQGAEGQATARQTAAGQVAQATVLSPVVMPRVGVVPLHPDSAPVSGSDDGLSVHTQPELAVDADLVTDDPSTDEGFGEPSIGTSLYPAESLAAGYYDDGDSEPEGVHDEPGDGGPEDSSVELTPAAELAPEAELAPAEADAEEPDDPGGPVFHRLFSAPTPPMEDEPEPEDRETEPEKPTP